jgi:C4-type Zn-finger protein
MEEITQKSRTMCDFLSDMPLLHLHWLVTTRPHGESVLKHTQTCKACSFRLRSAMEADFASLSPEEQEQNLNAARKILDDLRAERLIQE